MLKSLQNNLKENFLYYTVFITGAAVLIIEVVAVRLLSPYFGNTIYTFSSVISVILAALSLGYWYGGKIADNKPRVGIFYKIIFYSGLSVLLLELINKAGLLSFAYSLPLTWGPLLYSVLLFFVPSFLMGLLSPYAIGLQKQRNKKIGVGVVSGRVFFFSTLGSIAGSLSAGFILIPLLGISTIIFLVGCLLTLMGMPAFFLSTSNSKKVFILAVVLTGFVISNIYKSPPDIMYQKDGLYEQVTVLNSVMDNKPARILLLDRNFSAAQFSDSDSLVFEYTKHYDLYKYFNINLKHALVIGSGAFSIPGALIAADENVVVDSVDIEPSLYEIAQRYFNLKPSPRLKNHVADGRRFLVDSKQKYDLIFLDAYHSFLSIPTHLTTLEFFKLARSRMNKDAILAINVIGSTKETDFSFFFSELKTFSQVFPNNMIFSTQKGDSDSMKNYIFLGVNGSVKPNLSQDYAGEVVDLSMQNLDKYAVFTDDYAPIEYILAKSIPYFQKQ